MIHTQTRSWYVVCTMLYMCFHSVCQLSSFSSSSHLHQSASVCVMLLLHDACDCAFHWWQMCCTEAANCTALIEQPFLRNTSLHILMKIVIFNHTPAMSYLAHPPVCSCPFAGGILCGLWPAVAAPRGAPHCSAQVGSETLGPHTPGFWAHLY